MSLRLPNFLLLLLLFTMIILHVARPLSPASLSSRACYSFAPLLSPPPHPPTTQRQYSSTPMTMMPEGPEVRTLSDSISSLLTATPHELKAVTVLSGRYHPPNKEPADFTAFTESLTVATDNTITSWSCKGKFQYVSLPSQRSVWITLGMSGRFIFDNPHHRHARVNFLVEDVATRQTRDLTFVDARQFGTVKCCMNDKELEKKLASIGPDILADITMTGDDFLAVVKKQRNRMNTSKFLMNQQKLSGVGNYILAEVRTDLCEQGGGGAVCERSEAALAANNELCDESR